MSFEAKNSFNTLGVAALWHSTAGYTLFLDCSQKDLRTMKSIHPAVFAASLQCANEVKVGLRGTDVGVHLENLVVDVCRGDRRRKRREVPDSEA